MSTSTAAPAALARSDGAKVLTNGTAVAIPAPAPATHVVDTFVHYNAFTHEHPRAEVPVPGNAYEFSVRNRTFE
ncbi:MAG: hypothetical protein JF586_04260 [Burkholderiales bacterium]|nr:hypothetical protein [Burkholderiales bacterium]